jgi:hypothetical protein
MTPLEERDKLVKLFVEYWYDDEKDLAWYFNTAVRECPTLCAALAAEHTRLSVPTTGQQEKP